MKIRVSAPAPDIIPTVSAPNCGTKQKKCPGGNDICRDDQDHSTTRGADNVLASDCRVLQQVEDVAFV